MYYAFILNMWMTRRMTEEKVLSYVPKYISEADANNILLTPQNPVV